MAMAKMIKRKRIKKHSLEISMNSLLDIVMILLFFLIKYYSSTVFEVQTPEGMKLPQGSAKAAGGNDLSILVDEKQRILIQGQAVCQIQGKEEKNECLYSELMKRRSPASETNEAVNILIHKDHPYKVVKEIMHTCAMAGKGQFKLIVESKYQ